VRPRADQKTSSASLIVGAIAAFAVGALIVGVWQMLPSIMQMLGIPGAGEPTFASTGERLGIAARAPVLALCMSNRIELGVDRMTPADFYGLLQSSDSYSRFGKLLGKQPSVAPTTFTMVWGEVADCVFRQNGRTFCDPDNRALAVEAAMSLVRQAEVIGAPPQDQSSFMPTRGAHDWSLAIKRELDRMRDVKERVRQGLRTRLQEGRLIAADFGYFPPGEIRHLLRENRPTRNACAEEGMEHAQPQWPSPPFTRRSAEQEDEEARQRFRNVILQGLNRPWSSFCEEKGHRALINAIDHYFGHRAVALRSAAEDGPESERQVRRLWQTADDTRIERLTRETFGRGYFKPEELSADVRATIAELVRDERGSRRPCGG